MGPSPGYQVYRTVYSILASPSALPSPRVYNLMSCRPIEPSMLPICW